MKLKAICLVAVLLVPVFAFAQATLDPQAPRVVLSAPNPTPDAFGSSTNTLVNVYAWNFGPYSTTTIGSAVYKRWTSNGSGCCMEGGVDLPTGSLITKWDIVGCDTSMTGDITAALYGVDSNGNYVLIGPLVGTSGAPGCGTYTVAVSPAVQVDNTARVYGIEFNNGGDTTGAVSLIAGHVYFKRQVSPGPATATFADVSNASGIYKFVEALAAAGITGGCGGGNYCPNDPVTRGQMAVFISVALGLHYPN